MSRRSRQAGFTLIELLVVVVAITVVIVFLRSAPLPSCSTYGETPYTELPFDSISRVRYIEPLGLLSAPVHTYPADHIYVWFNKARPTDHVDLYAPGNIRVTELTSVTFLTSPDPNRMGRTDYKIRYAPCREATGTFSHVASLEGTGASRSRGPERPPVGQGRGASQRTREPTSGDVAADPALAHVGRHKAPSTWCRLRRTPPGPRS